MVAEAARIEQLRLELVRRYSVPPDQVRVIRAPYRICPLGAHIDHQLGTVTALAIDRSVLLAYVPGTSGEVRLSSLDFPGEVRFSVADVPPARVDDWGNYPRGAVRAIQAAGHPLTRGLVGVLSGRLHGGGVSSSAAVGLACLLALEDSNGLNLSKVDQIELDLWIENSYLGLRNGILDQAAILLSQRDHLTVIDCQTRAHELIPAAPQMPAYRILLAFSGLSKALVGTSYNRRVAECTQAAEILLRAAGRASEAPVLRNISAEEYRAFGQHLTGTPALRALHYFSETDRVGQGIAAWRAGDLGRFGQLMTESGLSSIENYECGSPPLIGLYQLLAESEGVLGVRFSGAGFRGCCVALVDPNAVEQVEQGVAARYRQQFPELAEQASIEICTSANGAERVGLIDWEGAQT